MKLKLFTVVTVILFNTAAQAYDSDFGVWNGVFLTKTIDPSFSVYFEAQSRVHIGSSTVGIRSNRLLLRPAVRYSIDENFQVMFGYGWTPNFSPYRGESRIWEQLQYQSPLTETWNQLYRLRLEQRWVSDSGGTAHRIRAMARFDHWCDSEKSLGLALWDEAFVALNSVTKGPQSGFDQNRIFVGPMLGFGKSARLEIGYLNVFVNPTAPTNKTFIHTMAMNLFANW